MAWNPSPEVQVARDAVKRLSELHGDQVKQVVILYTTSNNIGYVSFGQNKELCGQAKLLADKLYDRAIEYFEVDV